MSRAFDTIDRSKLMEHTRDLFGEDEWRMTLKLLAHTNLEVRLEQSTSRKFHSNIGTPQGDTLSPILFTVYLEFAMRELSNRLTRPAVDMNLPQEIGYADDQDFISRSKDFLNNVEEEATNTLARWSLHVNKSKTERTTITREADENSESWRKSKKLGTLLGDSEGVTRRRVLASSALNKAMALWRGSKVAERRRIHIYNTCVKPILTYNMGTWALTQSESNKLDAFHRTQLRRVIGIHYPDKISNKELYERTGSNPINEEMYSARWRLLGHTLRMDDTVPAKAALLFYFNNDAKTYQGRPRTTLPVSINNDLKSIHSLVKKRRLLLFMILIPELSDNYRAIRSIQ